MKRKKKARKVSQPSPRTRDPFEVYKALAETNALMEERTGMYVEKIVSGMQDRILAWAKDVLGQMVRARLESVERIYRAEPKKPGDLW